MVLVWVEWSMTAGREGTVGIVDNGRGDVDCWGGGSGWWWGGDTPHIERARELDRCRE